MTSLVENDYSNTDNPRTLIDALLEEQQRLTPVERFSRRHDLDVLPAQARYYRDLIPSTAPGPGQQYAFAVDLDACTGCKACVSACHSLNGLEEHEMWRSVGLLHGGTETEAYRQTVTTACHHCVEPGCLEGCPVMAYDKDEETGIVRHLDDQCIGCQYCLLKCPYDVPKYSERLGIVRKCDMCIGRLKAGEAPACVQACPHEAITIEIVDRAVITDRSQPKTHMLPGAFDSSYTKPTTRFFSKHPLPEDVEAGDEAALRLEHAHWPLVWMLLFTQMGAGLFAALAAALVGGVSLGEARVIGGVAWVALHLGLAVSVLHLGRPLGAWRFFLGLRTSWMSREILAFSLFSMLACATLAVLWLPVIPIPDGLDIVSSCVAIATSLTPWLAAVTALVGFAGVFTSVMIYADTRREFWKAKFTAPKFFGTVMLLGLASAAPALALFGYHRSAWLSVFFATVARFAMFKWESTAFRRTRAPALRRATRTVERLLSWVPWSLRALLAFSLAGGVLAMAMPVLAVSAMVLVFVTTFAACLIERYCFFAVCPAPRMPGGLSA